MSEISVFSSVQDITVRSLIQDTVTGRGHRIHFLQAADDLPGAFNSHGSLDLILIEGSNLSSAEETYLSAQLMSNSHVQIGVIDSGSAESLPRDLLCGRAVHVLRRSGLRAELERLLDDISRISRRHLRLVDRERKENAAAAPSSLNSTQCPILEELGDNKFFLALSPEMVEIHRQVMLLRGLSVSVLIHGESGTGKEIIAHLIHKHTRGPSQKFVNVNCAALPFDLLESELFGHTKGAFTGAMSDKPGRFEQADGGTILLDEIGEISAPMQAKLLHVLQDGQFTPLGARHSTRVDVQVLSATNICIEKSLANKTLREDLYYRLSTFTIHVPPLRERTMEIPYLVRQIIARASLGREFADRQFSPELMQMLPHYRWPGNLRELRNFVYRTLIIQDEQLAMRELQMKIDAEQHGKRPVVDEPGCGAHAQMRTVLRDVRGRTESRMIEQALEASGWNRRDAARSLEISYRALLYKIQQYGLIPGASRVG